MNGPGALPRRAARCKSARLSKSITVSDSHSYWPSYCAGGSPLLIYNTYVTLIHWTTLSTMLFYFIGQCQIRLCGRRATQESLMDRSRSPLPRRTHHCVVSTKATSPHSFRHQFESFWLHIVVSLHAKVRWKVHCAPASKPLSADGWASSSHCHHCLN